VARTEAGEWRSRAFALLIIPSAVDPPAREAGQASRVQMKRPTGLWLIFGDAF
jgi:hypothetical protein